MLSPSTVFETRFTPESMQSAGVEFRDYLVGRYGFLLGVACAVNLAALAFVLWSDPAPGPALYAMVFVAVLCPVWLLYRFYFAGPGLQPGDSEESLKCVES